MKLHGFEIILKFELRGIVIPRITISLLFSYRIQNLFVWLNYRNRMKFQIENSFKELCRLRPPPSDGTQLVSFKAPVKSPEL